MLSLENKGLAYWLCIKTAANLAPSISECGLDGCPEQTVRGRRTIVCFDYEYQYGLGPFTNEIEKESLISLPEAQFPANGNSLYICKLRRLGEYIYVI